MGNKELPKYLNPGDALTRTQRERIEKTNSEIAKEAVRKLIELTELPQSRKLVRDLRIAEDFYLRPEGTLVSVESEWDMADVRNHYRREVSIDRLPGIVIALRITPQNVDALIAKLKKEF